MSAVRKPAPGSLEALASRWLDAKQLARRSPASDAARRADLAVIAAILADTADRPEDPELPNFARQLSRRLSASQPRCDLHPVAHSWPLRIPRRQLEAFLTRAGEPVRRRSGAQ